MKISNLLNDMSQAIADFELNNPGKEPKIIFHPDTLAFYKKHSPKTYVNGKSITIYGCPFETDNEVDYFQINSI